MPILVHAVGRADLAPFRMPDRFRHEVTYFMTPGDAVGSPTLGSPKLGPNEYWIRPEEAKTIFDDGVFGLVSPLDGENKTEIELSEEQEDWLAWMLEHKIEHVRLEVV